MFWNSPEDQGPIEKWLWDHIIPFIDEKGLSFLVNEEVERIIKSFDHDYNNDLIESENNNFLTELSMLQGILKNKSLLITQLFTDLNSSCSKTTSENHLWLSPSDIFKLKQTILPLAKQLKDSLDNLLVVINSFKIILGNKNYSNKLQMIQSIQTKFTTKNMNEDDNNNNEYEEMNPNISFDNSMTKKVAQRTLSPEQYKQWKKAQKTSKRKEADD